MQCANVWLSSSRFRAPLSIRDWHTVWQVFVTHRNSSRTSDSIGCLGRSVSLRALDYKHKRLMLHCSSRSLCCFHRNCPRMHTCSTCTASQEVCGRASGTNHSKSVVAPLVSIHSSLRIQPILPGPAYLCLYLMERRRHCSSCPSRSTMRSQVSPCSSRNCFLYEPVFQGSILLKPSPDISGRVPESLNWWLRFDTHQARNLTGTTSTCIYSENIGIKRSIFDSDVLTGFSNLI